MLTTDKAAVWLARPSDGKGYYLAIFNLDGSTQELHYSWKELGLPKGKYLLRDLWEAKDLGTLTSLAIELPPHGSALYRVLKFR